MAAANTTHVDPLNAGEAALRRGAWAEARACFEAALSREARPEALEGLGQAAWGLNDSSTTFRAREEGYRLYRQRDDHAGAARLATSLALDHFYFRGEHAIASGWLQRAQRLLDGIAPTHEHGWLWVARAQLTAWYEHDFAAAQRLCEAAVELGTTLPDVDLEMVALVSQGQIGEGMRRLDEATLAAVTGEIADVDASCTSCCCLLFACEWTRDYQRAAQWVQHMQALATRRAHPTLFQFCRAHYAGLLICRGSWDEAEAELVASIADLERAQPALAAESLVRLADLRCRQGRFDEATALLDRADTPPFQALANHFTLLGRATVALFQNRAAAAVDLAERFLRTMPSHNRMERFGGLELLVSALRIAGDLRRAEQALAELRSIATAVGTLSMRAATCFAEGLVATPDPAAARRCFEDAVELWQRSGAPYEAALASVELAQALLALGQRQTAEQQALQAVATLQRLGAKPDAERAAALLRQINATPGADSSADDASLTPREREVLGLLAEGKTNQEIAAELVLSVRTVERHISNIYAKLGTTGATARATATAYALHHDL